MGMFDNPSAGQFDPPPGASERFEPPRPERRGTWVLLGLGIAYFAIEEYTRWSHPRGALAALSAVAMVVLWILQFVVRRQTQDENPYSEQHHVTR